MPEGSVRTCPGCGQALRFPSGIGGMLMACPVCGHRFATPFRLGGSPSASPPVQTPLTADAADQPEDAALAPTTPPPLRPNALAARVAALYAAKAR